MSFDRIAPHYRWLESLAFGEALQRARVAHISSISSPRNVLIVGEGNGRFLLRLVQEFPGARVRCVEASAQMIRLARERLRATGTRGADNVEFTNADIRTVALPERTYDLIVTHFFLDCFREHDVAEIVSQLSRSATQDAQWLLADFCVPGGTLAHRGARFWLKVMYQFFRIVSALEAEELTDPSSHLRDHCFSIVSQQFLWLGMVNSQLWRRVMRPDN